MGRSTPGRENTILGPYRVLPGRLSVSRTFGDAEAKLVRFGGNPKVIVAEPEIKAFRITKEHDFITMSSDGVFDKLSNKEIVQLVWDSIADNNQTLTPHQQASLCVDNILKTSLIRRTLDNVTTVIVQFHNLQQRLIGPFTDKDNKSNTITSKKEKKVIMSTDLGNTII